MATENGVRKQGKLTMTQKFQLVDWIRAQSNVNMIPAGDLAEAATNALGYNVSHLTVTTVCKSAGIQYGHNLMSKKGRNGMAKKQTASVMRDKYLAAGLLELSEALGVRLKVNNELLAIKNNVKLTKKEGEN